ncbi:MAG TPA: hypothetical protein VLS44_06830 [Nitrospira sp.]|nr:hypothetical protein [Nitrospira sp.]
MSVKISARNSLFPAILLSCALLASGCAASPNSQNLSRTGKGSIYLENLPDRSFQADHPTVIDLQTMLKVVKGLVTDETSGDSTKLPASGSKPMRVFSDEDAEFLAPLLAQGLSQSKPEQIVGFRVSPSAGSGAEPTAGTLYVREGSVHITITSSRSTAKTAGFLPRSVARIEAALPAAAHGARGAKSVAIDYAALAKAAVVSASPASTPDKPVEAESAALTADEFLLKQMEDLRRAKETAALKESEMSLLRKENNWLKEQLREKTAQVDALKAGTVTSTAAPKAKPKPGAELQRAR